MIGQPKGLSLLEINACEKMRKKVLSAMKKMNTFAMALVRAQLMLYLE